MKVGSLFSGIGLMDFGLEQAGMELSYILKICNITTSRYPNIYEWMMGAPLNFLTLNEQSKDTAMV